MHKVKCSNEQFTYEWRKDGHKIRKNDKGIKGSDTGVLIIEQFENKHRGAYECVVSTTSQPIVSVSAKLELDFHYGK